MSDLEKEIIGPEVKEHLIKADLEKLKVKINEKRWNGRLLQVRWQDRALSERGCFACLRDWTCARIYTISVVMELYDLWAAPLHQRWYGSMSSTNPQRVHKTVAPQGDVSCRMCGKSPETHTHVVSGCSVLAQSKYLERQRSTESLLLRGGGGTGANWLSSSLVFACSAQTNLRALAF